MNQQRKLFLDPMNAHLDHFVMKEMELKEA